MAKDQPGALQVPTFQALPLHRGGVLGVDRRAERLPPREADVMAVEARRVALPGSPGLGAGAPTLGFGAGSSPSVGAQLAARLDRRADLEATRSEVGRVVWPTSVRPPLPCPALPCPCPRGLPPPAPARPPRGGPGADPGRRRRAGRRG